MQSCSVLGLSTSFCGWFLRRALLSRSETWKYFAAFVPLDRPWSAFSAALATFGPLGFFSPSFSAVHLSGLFHQVFKEFHLAFGPFGDFRKFRIWVLSASERAMMMIAAEMQTVVSYASARVGTEESYARDLHMYRH